MTDGLLINPYRFGGFPILDSFTRANSTTTLGSTESPVIPWQALGGTWGIISNTAYRTTTTDDVAVVETGRTDVTVTVRLSTFPTTGFPAGVVARCTDLNNFYVALGLPSSGNIILYKRVAGTYTQLGALGSATWVAGDTLGISVAGSTIKAYRNGVEIISRTDTALTSGTLAGIRGSDNTAAVRFDDLVITAP